ncbi:HD domain-containing protein [Evansella cellulosilytica]|uniref:Metal dependent phosphohydrolase n=1 Tax=Evansella cellulosilytica (strain ATCC 21833 / DSM 2522 / FERM P-1141 / JCM 9156 / N-4) TaxID=649639 RepID=E6U0A6_EVAC2|nr:HD domain-containing protein [Evansella cellulosilytica]ADU30222.1 metal dependent phosphohydrolase [Evansella cellulosilytica DSM 2522]
MELKLIDEAVIFATNAHAKQYRKTDSTPYITHPYTAALFMQTHLHGSSFSDEERMNIIIAILLHDVIEDTDGTVEQITNIFGEKISELVIGASEMDKSKSWFERKSESIKKTKYATLQQKYVILADKIHNLHSMVKAKELLGSSLWSSFSATKKDQEWYYKNMYRALVSNLDEIPPLFKVMEQYITTLFQNDF